MCSSDLNRANPRQGYRDCYRTGIALCPRILDECEGHLFNPKIGRRNRLRREAAGPEERRSKPAN